VVQRAAVTSGIRRTDALTTTPLPRVVYNAALLMFVKICGITNQVDAELAIAAGADALGFNFWPRSRRYVEPEKAANWIRELPDGAVRVGVVVNPTNLYALTIAGIDGIDLLQLHGTESPEFCLNLLETGISLWKAIPMSFPTTSVPDYHINRLLLDTAAGGKFGGTGTPFPWSWARDLINANPGLELILAGGLTPENVEQAVTQCRPYGVDVATGVEGPSGRKDIYRVRDFITAARSV
jgi:phosphoribosylanthranilate isomerase